VASCGTVSDPEETADEQRPPVEVVADDRDERGRFVGGNPFRFEPGQSGNPSGRPLGHKQALKRILARLQRQEPRLEEFETAGELALDTLVREMLKRDSKARVQAAREIVDREFGRVPVAFKMGGDDDDGPRDIRIRIVGRDDVDRVAMRVPAKVLPAPTTGGNGDGKP
jgi:hypothetical protein